MDQRAPRPGLGALARGAGRGVAGARGSAPAWTYRQEHRRRRLLPEPARGAMAAAPRSQGRGAAHHPLQCLRRAAPTARRRDGDRLREPGHSRPHGRGVAGPGSGLAEVRALLDVESSRRGGRRRSHALRALRPRLARPATVTFAAVTALVVLVLDQLSKAVALRQLVPGTPISVVDGVFSLTLVMNPGLAFGMLSSTPTAWRWIVVVLSLAALAILATVGVRLLATGGWTTRVALGFIFGGAAGNLIDRGRFGAVVDFLDFYWRDYHWPAFNVADSAISVGVALLAVRIIWPSPTAP